MRKRIPVPESFYDATHQKLPFEAYRQMDAINAHGLMTLIESPRRYRQSLSEQKKPTPAMLLGTYFDMAITDPGQFFEEVACKGSPQAEQASIRHVMTPGEWHKLHAMQQSVEMNPFARQLIERRIGAPNFFWRDRFHPSIGCKARLDLICSFGGREVAVDIKTSRSPDPESFARECANRRYDLQVAHYLEAARATGAFDPDIFFFIVVGNQPPHDCYVYEAGDTILSRGTAWRDYAMQTYASCLQADDWPGPTPFQKLELPGWAKPPQEAESPAEDEDLSPPEGYEDDLLSAAE